MSTPVSKKTQESVSNEPLRILKIDHCPSLSGNSTLTYHVGCNGQGELQIRIYSNTGGGLFSNEWVDFNAIQQKLAGLEPAAAITSILLNSLLKGKSANTPGFHMAVLLAEGVLIPKGKRTLQWGRPDDFVARMQTLIEVGTDIQVEEPEKKTAIKPTASKGATAKTSSTTTAKKRSA